MVDVSRACAKTIVFHRCVFIMACARFGDKPLPGGGVALLAFPEILDFKRLQNCEQGPMLC